MQPEYVHLKEIKGTELYLLFRSGCLCYEQEWNGVYIPINTLRDLIREYLQDNIFMTAHCTKPSEKKMTKEEIMKFFTTLYVNGSTPSQKFGLTFEDLCKLEGAIEKETGPIHWTSKSKR